MQKATYLAGIVYFDSVHLFAVAFDAYTLVSLSATFTYSEYADILFINGFYYENVTEMRRKL